VNSVLQDESLTTYLDSPQVRLASKLQVIQEVIPGIRPLTTNLVSLLASRGVIGLFPRVFQEYQGFLNAQMGILPAEVVSAVELDDDQERRVSELLQGLERKEIKLTSRVDPLILGGIIARVGDHVIDGSTRTRLQKMRKSLAGGAS